MAVDEQTGLTFTSTHPAKTHRPVRPDGIREGVSPKRTGQLAYKKKSYDLDFYEGRLFVNSNGTEKFCEVNSDGREIISDHTTIGGITRKHLRNSASAATHAVHHRPRENGTCVYAIPYE